MCVLFFKTQKNKTLFCLLNVFKASEIAGFGNYEIREKLADKYQRNSDQHFDMCVFCIFTILIPR